MPAGLLYLPANSPKYAATRSPLWFVLGASSETTAAVRAQWESTPQWQALASDITALRFQEALATLSGWRLEQSPGAQPKSA